MSNSIIAARFSSSSDQSSIKKKISQKIIFENLDFDTNVINYNGDIYVGQSGIYFVIVSLQIGQLCVDCLSDISDIKFWINVNNRPLSNSGFKKSLVNKNETDKITSQRILRLNAGDFFSVEMNFTGSDSNCSQVGIISYDKIIPSATLSIYSSQLTPNSGPTGAVGSDSFILTAQELSDQQSYRLTGTHTISSCFKQIIASCSMLTTINQKNIRTAPFYWSFLNNNNGDIISASYITIQDNTILFTFDNPIFCPTQNILMTISGTIYV